jgi:hypothetical protein
MEKQCVFVTAAQLNRGAVEEVEFDHSHISGGLSKIQTADNVFGIFTSRAMRERGKYQIQLMKTRSSSGVGMKIDLDFDIDTLRITDPGIEGDNEYRPKSSAILDDIKRKSTTESINNDTGEIIPDPTVGVPLPKIKAQADSTKLRQFLNNMGGSSDPTKDPF